MNWYKKTIKLSQASPRGEYWIMNGGDIAYADSDTGSMGHEAHVIEEIMRKYADGMFCRDEYVDWDGFKEYLFKQQIGKEVQQQPMLFQPDQIEYIYKDKRNELINKALRELGISEEEMELIEGHGDARKYAMQNWGWKRVQDNNIETWTLTSEDMRDIVRGINEIMEYSGEEEGEPTVNISVYRTGHWYTDIPLSALESQNPMSAATFRSFASKKTAAPIVEMPEHASYFDVGHKEKDNKTIMLWIIDNRYNFHKIKIEDNVPYTHHDWVYDYPEMEEMRMEYNERYDALAHGRYEVESHMASAAINNWYKLNELQKRFIKEKVIEILDYKLDNPAIYWIE